MWDGLFMLLSLSIVMAIASFLAGSLPLSFALSSKQLRFITAIGTGVLVGTSLVVIIPEGVETLYSAHGNNHAHKARAVAFTARSLNGLTLDLPGLEYSGKLTPRDLGIPPAVKIAIREAQDEDDDAQEGNMTGPDDGRPVDAVTPSDEDATPPKSTDEVLGREGVGHDREPHVWVGISLILGFILMYLIDRVPHLASASAQPRRFYVSLDRLTLRRSSQTDEDADDNFPPPDGAHKPRSSSTTVGLVIHAAADGIALGASSTTSSTRLGFIIFLALMIHKAPAAFGLTSVLLKQGLSKRQARTRLIVFSLAAPAGALAAWTAANIFGGGSFGGEEGTKFATGVLLLFSGGTFLYVAMHTMQDNGHGHAGDGSGQDGYAATPTYDSYQQQAAHKQDGATLSDTLATVAGMLLPLLTQFGHAH